MDTNAPAQTRAQADRAAILRRNLLRRRREQIQFAMLAAAATLLLLACLYAFATATGEPWHVGDYATAPAPQP